MFVWTLYHSAFVSPIVCLKEIYNIVKDKQDLVKIENNPLGDIQICSFEKNIQSAFVVSNKLVLQ
jgi:hypothetical protein